MSEPDYHRLGGEQLRGDRKRLAQLEEPLLEKFARWESLEEQRARSPSGTTVASSTSAARISHDL
jgi:hypothetical protein